MTIVELARFVVKDDDRNGFEGESICEESTNTRGTLVGVSIRTRSIVLAYRRL